MINFIGVGAQKAGTSWIYACLYEHPEICAPIKELHFFSRKRFAKGTDWYESHFKKCKPGTLSGEFSTSYLSDEQAAERIADCYPDAKLIAVLRNPIDRAYSQYRNAIKSGEIRKHTSFKSFLRDEPSALGQGFYGKQLNRYYEYFSNVQMKVLIYEDLKKDPLKSIQELYEFLEVDSKFVPSMLKKHINTTRTPRFVFIERIMHRIAEGLRKVGLDKLVWFVKKSGVTDVVRTANTEATQEKKPEFDREELAEVFADDVSYVSQLVHRNLREEWNI